MEAKETQVRYGYNNCPAKLLILEKALIVKTIATQRTTISTKARVGFFIPKNIIDQAVFKISWIQKTLGTFFFSQTKYKDIPIRI